MRRTRNQRRARGLTRRMVSAFPQFTDLLDEKIRRRVTRLGGLAQSDRPSFACDGIHRWPRSMQALQSGTRRVCAADARGRLSVRPEAAGRAAHSGGISPSTTNSSTTGPGWRSTSDRTEATCRGRSQRTAGRPASRAHSAYGMAGTSADCGTSGSPAAARRCQVSRFRSPLFNTQNTSGGRPASRSRWRRTVISSFRPPDWKAPSPTRATTGRSGGRTGRPRRRARRRRAARGGRTAASACRCGAGDGGSTSPARSPRR